MQPDLLALARPEIVAMSSYASARSGSMRGDIWLDANENTLDHGQYNRYPEPQPYTLITNMAAIYGVNPDQLLVTRGSDEGIDLLVRLFCRAGKDKIMICPPTYGMYKVSAILQDAAVIEVPLLKEMNFLLDTTNILETWHSCIKLIFLCCPNNPTGNLHAVQDILSLCNELDGKSIIIIDEAYIEFSAAESFTKYLSDYPNLVVLRTLSKAYGMAGIRCGVTIANPTIIKLLKKIIAPYPVPKPIVDIALKHLSQNVIKDHIRIIHQERNMLFEFLSNLSIVKKVWKSEANFLLFEVSNSRMVIEACIKHNIILRDRGDEHNLSNCVRLTIGSPSENRLLMEALSHV